MATSKLHQFLDDIDDKILECTICLKRLQNPKSLSCLHSFCLVCLEDWLATGALTCPTCCKPFHVPPGGIEKLPPNTFINKLIEIIDQFSEGDQNECVCGERKAVYYCPECRIYLCSTCGDSHQDYKLSAAHKLHSVEDMQSMSAIELASLHPPLCSTHNKPVECYCLECKKTVCVNCTILNHKEHKIVSISEAFKTFKKTAETLKSHAYNSITKLQDGIGVLTHRSGKLEQNKDMTLRSIESHRSEVIKAIKKNGNKMKEAVHQNYKENKTATDQQINELKTTISDINMKLSLLDQVLKSDDSIAVQSSDMVVTALEERIKELPEVQVEDIKVYFFKNELQNTSLQQAGIGYVSTKRVADCLSLEGNQYLTRGETAVIKIVNEGECEIDVNQLQATWTQPTGETKIAQIEEDIIGNYFVTEKFSYPGVCKLDVKLITDNRPIKIHPWKSFSKKKKLI